MSENGSSNGNGSGREITSTVVRGERGRWVPGAGSPNPGGRRRKLAEIEQMLDADHRTVEKMREVFGRLRALALGEVVEISRTNTDGQTQVVRIELRAAPEFMRLYLERVLGPVKEIDDIDLTDAPPEVVEWLRSLN